MKLKSCLMAILWPALQSCAQSTIQTKPLTVGDTIPNIILTDVINFPVSRIQLSQFKGKLVILDFWASWCGSCLKGIPVLDSLQKEFAGKIQIVMINPKKAGDNLARVEAAIARVTMKQTSFILPIVLADTVAFNLFHFSALPHYIWIDGNRVIRAVTGSKQVTRSNINAFLKGEEIHLPVKTDFAGM